MFFNAFSSSRHIFATLAGLIVSGLALADTAGRVNFVAGDVNVTNIDNNTHILVKGDMVSGGETISTGTKGRVQIRLADGGFLSLRPNSVFKIEKYNFSKDTPTQGSLLFNFIKGGMRTISGAIGKVNRSNYQMNTPFATIGIRGTDYAGEINNDQLVVTVNKGAINVANEAGSADVPAGETFAVKKGTAPAPSSIKVNSEAFETEEECVGAACSAAAARTAPIIVTAADGTLEKPRLENFANYNDFIHAMTVYQRLEAEQLRVSEVAKQLTSGPSIVALDMNMETLEADEALTITSGSEDLNEAVDKAKNIAPLALADLGQGRSTFNNFPLKAEDSDSLQDASVSYTLMRDNDFAMYFNKCVNHIHVGINDCILNNREFSDFNNSAFSLDQYNNSLLPETFFNANNGLLANITHAYGIDFSGLTLDTFINSSLDTLSVKLTLGSRNKELLSSFGVSDSLLSAIDDNKNGMFGGGSIRRGVMHDGDGISTHKNSGALEIGNGSASDSTALFTDDSQPISTSLTLETGANAPANNAIISLNVITPKIGLKLGGIYVSNSDSAVPGLNKNGESTPGSARIYGTNTDGSIPVQVMGSSEIILGAATISARIKHNPQFDSNRKVSPLTILADLNVKDGITINGFSLIDATGRVHGGSLGASSLKISDYSSSDLTAKLSVDFEKQNDLDGITLTLKQLGDIVNGANIMIAGLRAGDISVEDIGDLNVMGLNMNGIQLILSGH